MDGKALWKKRLLWWILGLLGVKGVALIALLGLMMVMILGMFASSSDSSMGRVPVPGQESWDLPPALLPLYLRAENEEVSWARLAAIHRVSTNFGLEPADVPDPVGAFGFPRSLWETDQVDGDRDGRLDPDNPADAIFSLANVFRLRSEANSSDLLALFFPDPDDVERVYEKEREYAALLLIDQDWLWPVWGYTALSSPYGYRVDPVTGEPGAFHDGIDIPAPLGTPVAAIQDGIVVETVRSSTGYGNRIRLRHAGGIISLYAHLTEIGVREGESVPRGRVIGWVGSTGKSTGTHLHLGLSQNGQSMDPALFWFDDE